MDNDKPGIEEGLKKLEDILSRMESEETGLEQSFKLYEEGLKTIKSVSESIDKVEKELEVLDAGL